MLLIRWLLCPAGSGAPLRARRSVLARLAGRLPGTGEEDLALVVSELVTNSVLHANAGPDEFLTVECATLPDRMRVTVTDPGSQFEPHLRSPTPLTSGGYGLRLVEALCTGWGFACDRAGTTTVWCELPLDLATAAGSDSHG